tara:strand:- start:851 stop:3733 length:2883 start_codon:yes stop_codon:yes gene_type:complete
MIGTEVLVEGYLLDVVSGADFSFNYAVSDVREPDKRQTEFTKTIRCAGTANNNTLFGNLFEADIANLYDASLPNIGANFNPNKKASVQVLHNSLPQLDGSMQLRKISITEGLIEYEVVFIGKLIDIFGVWGDQQLNGRDDEGNRIIDISELNHTLTESNQSATWFAPVGVGYVYPLIDYGRDTDLINYYGQRTYPAINLRPALYVQELWNRIFAYADATYEGSFFTDGTFERLCLPWVNGFELSEDDIAARAIYARLFATSPIIWTIDYGSITTFSSFSFLVCDEEITDPSSQYNTSNGATVINQTGTYVFSGYYKVLAKRIAYIGPILDTYVSWAAVYINGVLTETMNLAVMDLPLTILEGGPQSGESFNSYTSSEISLNAGDVVAIGLWMQGNLGIKDEFEFRVIDADYHMDTVVTDLAYGNTVYMNFGMPETTIKDFFLSILKMFNLYMTPSKTVDRHYIFQTRNDYYASGVLRDWTYKLARDKQLSVTPMGLLSGREYVYTYKEDGDYYNERFQSNYGKAYGHRTLNIDNDFVPEKKETSVVFSGTPLVNDGISSRIIPKIYDADISEGAKQTDANIRILYYGGMLDSSPSWNHQITTGTVITYDQYPYAGHWDNPITPTLDINWGLSQEYYYQSNGATGTVQVTNNNLFKKYHESQFLELASKDSKLITAMFYLTELDIQQLDFRDTILIDQTYYRLNKVIDYNPFKTGLTKVELFKAGDIVIDEKRSAAMGSGKSLGSGKLLELAPINPSKKLLNGNQFEPFQGKVIGRENVVSPNAVGFFVQGDNNKVGATKNVTLIGSNNVVADGVENVTAIGVNNLNITQSNTTYPECYCVKVAELTLTSAQILALNTTPIPFGITVPSGFYIQPLSIQMSGLFNTTPYATNTNMYVAFGGSLPLFIGDIGFISDTFINLIPESGGKMMDNTDLNVIVDSGNPTAGNSAIKLYLTYILVQI